jgi:alditol oxidase
VDEPRVWAGDDRVPLHLEPESAAVEELLVDLEAALSPFEARPHWGKLCLAGAAAIAPLYQRRPDFIHLLERLDPRAAFSNSWLKKYVLGDA